MSQNKFQKKELKIMEKCHSPFLVQLLDSFTIQVPFLGTVYCSLLFAKNQSMESSISVAIIIVTELCLVELYSIFED